MLAIPLTCQEEYKHAHYHRHIFFFLLLQSVLFRQYLFLSSNSVCDILLIRTEKSVSADKNIIDRENKDYRLARFRDFYFEETEHQ